MFKDILNIIKSAILNMLNSKIIGLCVFFVLLFTIILGKLFYIQIIHGDEYVKENINKAEKVVSIPGTRGNIYDREGNLLAYNELVWNVIIQDSDEYLKNAEGINERNRMYLRLAKIFQKYQKRQEEYQKEQEKKAKEGIDEIKDITDKTNKTEENYMQLDIKYEVALDDDNVFYFTSKDDKHHKTFIANIYGRDVEDLDGPNGKYPSNITAQEAFEYSKKRYAMDKMLDEKGTPLVIDTRTLLLMIGIHYTMRLTSFQKYQTTTIAQNIPQSCLSEILENKGELRGVEVEQASLRRYSYGKYFANIIGYTGAINRDQYEEYILDDPTYTLRDYIGLAGIEKTYEKELRGKTGYRRIYVDSRGKVLQVLEEVQPTSGNDVHLTISIKDQVAVYHLIEQQLSAIVADRLVNEIVDNSKRKSSAMKLSISDAYYQLINNNILDYKHFMEDDAKPAEKEIYKTFLVCKDEVREKIYNNLVSQDDTAFKDLPQDMQNYLLEIFRTLVSKGVVLTDKIDKESAEYKRWREDNISLSEYLLKCIHESWVNASIVMGDERFADTNTIYAYLINYVLQIFDDSDEYDKLVYHYEIRNKNIPSRLIIMALYEQNVLPWNEVEYKKLSTANDDFTYQYMKNLILGLKITAKDLAMDPCNGSAIITDVTTGKVKALVSYPSFDNNRINEAGYLEKLRNDQTLPLLNVATQTTLAPGSTFKPITGIASLEEEVIDTKTEYVCTGIYELTEKPIKCWVYPYSHDKQVISDGFKNSCNCFFANLGYLLSLNENKEYSTVTGLANITKYAEMFSLHEKSGLEIEETISHISNIDPERSAMGQGDHAFNNAQLARYTAALANTGTVFQLSCVNQITSKEKKVIAEFPPVVTRQLDFDSVTWSTVKEGLRRVITEGNARVAFSKENKVHISGKTGTAEERNDRGTHSLFISYAPSENPQIAVNVLIPFGYSSGNAACLANSVYNYYYGYTSYDQVISQDAFNTRTALVAD